ncbi:sulfate/molybdate ABC transporter ATP-binding protein [Bacillus sp. Marseille-P3661]|uniref:sulfate/molybdate ABC transporter ATP-binding protein n=1 Tax=Bacillus sp. Marseille-P3661 TaxID=1936234 RepID=UPI000C833104|nr:ATP-binding cassette domain-containing protein [Bacillus sp. Marseille-P3661]
MLQVEIKKTLNNFQLDVSFKIGSGITGIIGPSGCGKSITLQCIAGLQTPDKGNIGLNNELLYHSEQKLNTKPRNRNIGYVFQNYALFPHLTVEKNIEYGLKGKTKLEKKEMVASMINKVRLTGYENHYPRQLSGGQQQRVALARTLVTDPELLLLDEPFSALDHHVKHLLEQELLSIIKENYSGIVILVTHNMEEAYRLCDQLVLLNNGQIIQAGDKETVFSKPLNVTAAKVIGCKNILPIDSLIDSGEHIECHIQGVNLTVKQQVIPKTISHIGIYQDNIHFIEFNNESDYAYPYEILEIVKGIHQANITIKVKDAFILTATLPNYQIESLLKGTYKVKLSPKHLFLLQSS